MTAKKKVGSVLTVTNNTGAPLALMGWTGATPLVVPVGGWRDEKVTEVYEWESQELSE